ncbi:hypothetical protein TanjilG_13504 [Lupinus angustifolius]|uniref:RRM domain-containing protein n=1 Tax=Lupinus angustifolius TaxID=3871 RepID=A0A4P1RVR5_LUPAN|nr:PREDICTED: uncharacterized protein LOC109361680 [Lupinus angustifolius]OIW18752.1 hypothetical protein TanjilG_13504 [Lupinus angustifolius]
MDSPFKLPSLSASITNEELRTFHNIDRIIYWILVINLSRDPAESMHVLAMLLWLEKVGYRHLIKKMTTLPYILINEIADEVVSCLKYINIYTFSYFSYMSYPTETCEIPLLQSIVEKEISAQLLYDNRDLAFKGIAKILHDVCSRAFRDILQHALMRNMMEKMAEEQRKMQEAQFAELQQQQPPPPFWFAPMEPSSSVVLSDAGYNQFPVQNQVENNYDEMVPADERTLFLTFSKGYPVEEQEVKEFFTLLFGDSVEGLYMQEVQPGEQALYARIVFRSSLIIDMIIQGSSKAKFCINGKHVWARKFVPKRSKSLFPIPTYNSNYYVGESSGTAGMM